VREKRKRACGEKSIPSEELRQERNEIDEREHEVSREAWLFRKIGFYAGINDSRSYEKKLSLERMSNTPWFT